jgi:hypothetical protein
MLLIGLLRLRRATETGWLDGADGSELERQLRDFSERLLHSPSRERANPEIGQEDTGFGDTLPSSHARTRRRNVDGIESIARNEVYFIIFLLRISQENRERERLFSCSIVPWRRSRRDLGTPPSLLLSLERLRYEQWGQGQLTEKIG